METYDLIIIGAGPAGMTAAIYAARYKVKTLVIGKILGGTASTAHRICNYPGEKEISGTQWSMKVAEQVKALGVEIKNEVVETIKQANGFEIKTNKTTYSAKKLILATGAVRRKLGLAKEAELFGKGISYCATCDASFYKDKMVGVVGGSDSALTTSLLLAKFATKVYLIHRTDKFERAEPTWVDEVKKEKKIETLFNSEVKELIGDKKLEGIKLSSGKQLKLGGLFIEIGGIPNTKLSNQLGIKLEKGEIKVDKYQKTSLAGVFAVGDITNNPLKQIVTATGQGATAALSAYDELQKK